MVNVPDEIDSGTVVEPADITALGLLFLVFL